MPASKSSIFTDFTTSRYRNLILSIGIFLVLILLLLIFTFYTSNLLEKDTATVGEVSAVSKSSEVIIKDLFDLQNSYGESIQSPHIKKVHSRLEATVDYINNGFEAIENGGEVEDEFGNSYDLDPLTDQESLEHLQSAQKEWALLEPKVKTYLKDARDVSVDSSDNLSTAVEQAKTSSLSINESLSALVYDVYSGASNRAKLIRFVQIFGVAVILLYFAFFIFFFIRRLRQSDVEAIEARRETEEIMQTVNTGLFLLDKNLMIGNQYSAALSKIIGTQKLAGENLTSVLRNRISDKDLETTKQFIEQLYNPRVKTKLINDLNPLNKVMMHHSDTHGPNDDTYLDFRFSRVYEDKKIARILVNVTDVTDAVRLEKRLENEREQNDQQIEMLTTILNVQPHLINGFINNTNSHIDNINNVLKSSGSSDAELQEKLKAIYREIHSLKGEASSLKLHSFTQISGQIEDKLQALQGKIKLSGNDFLPLTVDLDELMNLTATIESLGDRINQSPAMMGTQYASQPAPAPAVQAMQPASAETQSAAASEINQISNDISGGASVPITNNVKQASEVEQQLDYYTNFVNEIATRQNKKAQLKAVGFETAVPANLHKTFQDIVIQLLRNSVVHGIETPNIRLANGKPEQGVVKLIKSEKDNMLLVAVEDDGAGINYPAIRQRLVSLGHHTEETINSLSKSKLLNALFSSGFSTKTEADEDGGRGVGLDIIKELVQSVNGKINVHSEPNKNTRFTIALPL